MPFFEYGKFLFFFDFSFLAQFKKAKREILPLKAELIEELIFFWNEFIHYKKINQREIDKTAGLVIFVFIPILIGSLISLALYVVFLLTYEPPILEGWQLHQLKENPPAWNAYQLNYISAIWYGFHSMVGVVFLQLLISGAIIFVHQEQREGFLKRPFLELSTMILGRRFY